MNTRGSIPHLYICCNTRPAVHRDDTTHVVVLEVPQNQGVTGRLQQLTRVLQRKSRHSPRFTGCAWVDVFLEVHPSSADRRCPRLIGNLSIRGIHDHGRPDLPRHDR